MPWNPDAGTALTADEIRVADVERTSMALWQEFLSGWFDGQAHFLRGAQATLPAVAKLTFQEQDLPNPLDGLYLHVVLSRTPQVTKRLWNDGIWRLTEKVRLDFYFRSQVKAPRADGHNSRSLVRWGADTLYAILQSNLHTIYLAHKGMGVFRPTPATLTTGSTVAMRLLSCASHYTYSNEETTMSTAPVIQSDQSASIVYIGADREIRVTPEGYEQKGPDGNWYRISIQLLQGDDGLVPSLDVTPVES